MSIKAISALLVTAVVAVAGIAVYVHMGIPSGNSSHPALSDLQKGTHITITANDKKMIGGTVVTSFLNNGYYGLTYNIDPTNYSILSGSWSSTSKSLVWLYIDNVSYFSTPLPESTSGVLNQTLSPGHYTLVIGGYPGDVISIMNPILLNGYVPSQVGNFSIAAGTHVRSATSYLFNLSQPGELVGDLTSPAGKYSLSLYNTTGIGFGESCNNSSAKPGPLQFTLSPEYQALAPGHYNLSLSSGFYVNSTIHILYFYDYSIA